MARPRCSGVVRLVSTLSITVGLCAPAAAQSIAVISPHAGEQVGAHANLGGYWVRWSASNPAGVFEFVVSVRDVSGQLHEVCTAASTASECEWPAPALSARTILVDARDGSGVTLASGESGAFQVVDEQLPQGWRHTDVGAVGRSGGAWGLQGTTVGVRGAGGDIWGAADAFHGAFWDNPSDMDATFTITTLDGSDPWTKVGVMVRESLLPGSPHHFVLASRSRGLAYQRRHGLDDDTIHTPIAGSSALPVTIHVMRRSNHVVMDVRQGQGAWTRAAEFDVNGPRLLGMAVTSHDTRVLATGVFTGVSARHVAAPAVQIVTPQIGETLLAGVPYTIAWQHTHTVNLAAVSYTVDGGRNWHTIPGCTSVTTGSCRWTAPGPASEAARIRVVLQDPNDRTAWTVTPPFAIRNTGSGALPPGWRHFDVGAVGAAGSAAYDAATGTFTVDGSGRDIWSTSDEFQMTATQLPRWGQEDDFDVTARVLSVQPVDSWTKAGIMVRSGTGPDAVHASLFATPTTGNGVAFQRRRGPAEVSVHAAGPSVVAPVWLKLVVRGWDVRAYYRHRTSDPWTFLSSDVVRFSGTIFEIGLAVTSHRDGTLARATFDRVSVRRAEYPGEEDIGAVGLPGSGGGDDVTVTMSGSGADIWGTADAFRFRWMFVWSRAIVSARVRTLGHTHPWAKAGVMLREDTSPGSRHVMLIVSPVSGIAMQYRAVRNGPTANIALSAGRAPVWLRLVRTGSLVVGEASSDGETWRELGRVDLPMAEGVAGGLVVTSHDNTTLATAVFDDVILQP